MKRSDKNRTDRTEKPCNEWNRAEKSRRETTEANRREAQRIETQRTETKRSDRSESTSNMKVKPVRLQLSRKKGARLVSPNGLPIKVVSRPSKWGNPYKTWHYCIDEHLSKKEKQSIQREMAVRDFEMLLELASPPHPLKREREILGFDSDDVKRELKGCNLACWCPLDHECHADVLLRIANE